MNARRNMYGYAAALGRIEAEEAAPARASGEETMGVTAFGTTYNADRIVAVARRLGVPVVESAGIARQLCEDSENAAGNRSVELPLDPDLMRALVKLLLQHSGRATGSPT